MKREKSVKSETETEREVKSPIVTETNHPDPKLLANSAKHKNNQRRSTKQAEKQQPKQAERKAEKLRWVKSTGYIYRFRFVVKKHKKTPRTFKVGSTKLYYAKSLEHLADRIASIPYIQAIVGDIEKFNAETGEWEVVEQFN